MSQEKRVLIMGAGGRDFHTYLTMFRDDPDVRVVAITATQIPFIDERMLPPDLAGPRYPEGIQIVNESETVRLIDELKVDEVVFAYSDVSYDYVAEKRAMVEATGAAFRTFDVHATMVESTKPVIAVTAVRTGCGKSAVSRAVVSCLGELGLRTAAIRHPMPYGNLSEQAVQRFATYQDLIDHKCTIEEREEYEPHIMAGSIVFAGVDYTKILRRAEEEVDVVVWDGGNNDTSFYKPDLWFVLGDPMRPGHEVDYFPGDVAFREADAIIMTKMQSASPEGIAAVAGNAARLNPDAALLKAHMPITLTDEEAALVKGKRVLVVEDGPTVTHGGMKTGAGTIAAEQYGAAEIIEPRPFVKGLLKDTFDRYPEIGCLLPAMGYSDQQIADLEASINASDCDVVVIGTPLNLQTLINIDKPSVWARYEVDFPEKPDVCDLIKAMLKEKGVID